MYDFGNISPGSANWPLWWENIRERGFNHVKTYGWNSETKPDFDGQFPGAELLASSINIENSIDYLFMLDGCLVHIWWSRNELSVYFASNDRLLFPSLEEKLKAIFPEMQLLLGKEVRLKFWFMGGQGNGSAFNRLLSVPDWDEIHLNYGQVVRDEMSRLTGNFRPSHGGQLLLWQGPPGTGKTFAIRSLVREWASWCDSSYIVDPENFFGTPNYMMQVLLDSSRGPFSQEYDDDGIPVKERWKLIILEDSGELLSSDAKLRTGQALSRLLNIADGLIGQGLKVLILITTNEEMASLHEAISRPGRCASKILFPRLSKDEAIEWAHHNDLSLDVENDMSLAELYGVMEGYAKAPEAPKRGIGFRHKEAVANSKAPSKKSIGFDVGSRPEPDVVRSDQTAYTEDAPGHIGGEEEYLDVDD
jgi:hypothetical protein